MNTNAFFNRCEILLYSTLISAMSGINHFRAQIQNLSTYPIQHSPAREAFPTQITDQIQKRSLSVSWKAIQQVLLQLLIWAILGFTAGYLIGMVKPW